MYVVSIGSYAGFSIKAGAQICFCIFKLSKTGAGSGKIRDGLSDGWWSSLVSPRILLFASPKPPLFVLRAWEEGAKADKSILKKS